MAGSRFNPALSEDGRLQADAVGQRLAEVEFTSVRVSPLRRTIETAELIEAHRSRGPACTVDPDLVECHRGQLEGVPEDDPDVRAAWRGGTWEGWPGGERRTDFRERLRRVLAGLHDHPGVHLLVTHGNVINELLCLAAGVSGCAPFKPAIASLSVLRTDRDGVARIVAVNDLWHFDDVLPQHLAP